MQMQLSADQALVDPAPHSFRNPQELPSLYCCEYCGELGDAKSSVRCDVCNLFCHSACSNSVSSSFGCRHPSIIADESDSNVGAGVMHRFLSHQYKGTSYCNYCRRLVKDGYRCAICKYAIHKECKKNSPKTCKQMFHRVPRMTTRFSHQLVEGNCQPRSCCDICSELIVPSSTPSQGIFGARCVWCDLYFHPKCLCVADDDDSGGARRCCSPLSYVLPPTCITEIPEGYEPSCGELLKSMEDVVISSCSRCGDGDGDGDGDGKDKDKNECVHDSVFQAELNRREYLFRIPPSINPIIALISICNDTPFSRSFLYSLQSCLNPLQVLVLGDSSLSSVQALEGKAGLNQLKARLKFFLRIPRLILVIGGNLSSLSLVLTAFDALDEAETKEKKGSPFEIPRIALLGEGTNGGDANVSPALNELRPWLNGLKEAKSKNLHRWSIFAQLKQFPVAVFHPPGDSSGSGSGRSSENSTSSSSSTSTSQTKTSASTQLSSQSNSSIIFGGGGGSHSLYAHGLSDHEDSWTMHGWAMVGQSASKLLAKAEPKYKKSESTPNGVNDFIVAEVSGKPLNIPASVHTLILSCGNVTHVAGHALDSKKLKNNEEKLQSSSSSYEPRLEIWGIRSPHLVSRLGGGGAIHLGFASSIHVRLRREYGVAFVVDGSPRLLPQGAVDLTYMGKVEVV